MIYKVTYDGTPRPNEETVEADEHSIDGDWIVFKRYVPTRGPATVLRIKASRVDRVDLVSAD